MPNTLCVLRTSNFVDNPACDVRPEQNTRVGIAQFDLGMEWGTIMVFTCPNNCDVSGMANDGVAYYEECVLVQYEE